MADCIFCKIINGEIPARKIAESTDFLAILDAMPNAPGHSLVMPKKHSANFLDMPDSLGNEFLAFTQKVASAVMTATNAEGFNLALNHGAAAGQVVFHTHFHVIPRKPADNVQVGRHIGLTPEEFMSIQDAIVQRLT